MAATKKMVLVEWRDAVHQFGWQEGEEAQHNEDSVVSIGWLMHKDKKKVILAQSVGCENHAQTLQIPTGMMIRLVELGEKGKAV